MFDKVLVSPEQPAGLFLEYEYGEIDNEGEFDRDDITWFSVFEENGETARQVFDDETA